jgi:hypothetical protein
MIYPLGTSNTFDLEPNIVKMHDITVELRTAINTPAPAALTTTAVLIPTHAKRATGEFTISNVPFGNYILYIKRAGYLHRTFAVSITAASTDIVELAPPNTGFEAGGPDNGVFNLWWGDVNGEGRIDHEDQSIVLGLAAHNPTINARDPQTVSKYLAECDFNGDGLIDSEDVKILEENLDRISTYYAGAVK